MLPGCEPFDSHTGSARIAWSVALPSTETGWIGFPAATQGLFIAETGTALRAFDVVTGRTVWRTQLRTGVARVGAENIATAAGRVFAAGGDSVYALSAATGERLWSFLPDAQAALCVTAADVDAVYVGTRSHRVYALSATSGSVLWWVDVGPNWPYLGIINGIAVSGDTVYVNALQYLNDAGGLRTGHVFAVDRRTGAELWHFTGPDDRNDATHAPATADATLLIASVYATDTFPGSFFALDRFTGEEKWRISTAGFGPSEAPLEHDGTVYAGAGDTRVYAALLATGDIRWSESTGGSISAVALCGRTLLINNLELRALDLKRGRVQDALLSGQDQDFPTSGFATIGNRAFVVGNAAVYGIECDQ
jgi:outer membrane protein assembly factor BamB